MLKAFQHGRMSTGKFNPGDKVKIMRKIGKDGIPTLVTGIVNIVSSMIKIQRKTTILVDYDDGDNYFYKISDIEKI